MRVTFNDLAEVIGGIYYGGFADDVETTEGLISYLEENEGELYFSTEEQVEVKKEIVPKFVATWYSYKEENK